jgi:hypothetical protein
MADLNALAVFAKVMEAGSFSEGAHRLKMPISTVSRRVNSACADLAAIRHMRWRALQFHFIWYELSGGAHRKRTPTGKARVCHSS